MTPLLQEAVRAAPEPETAMWFDVGQLTPAADIRVPVDQLLHLPFERTGVAGIDTQGKPFTLWLKQGDDNVTVAGCTLHPVAYMKPFAYVRTETGVAYYLGGQQVDQAEVLPIFRIVVALLLKLNDATAGYRATPKTSFLNRRRQAKGKPALSFDWHTVDLGRRTEAKAAQGGTHASPRLHDRRGHWRNLASGKQVWVKPCKVGDAAKGAVFKDYRIREDAA